MAFNATTVTADAFTVVPSDSTKITAYGFYVGGTGDVTVVTLAGTTTTFYAVPVGVIIPQGVSKIKSTGTTASLITAFGPK